MQIAFTICSNNYLAYAGALCDSLKQHHPDWLFLLGLVDEPRPSQKYERFRFDAVVPVKDMNISGLQALCKRYNIIELNTAVKPFYFAHLRHCYPQAQNIFYFDPDIKIYNPLDTLVNHLAHADVLLIPHFRTPQISQQGILSFEQRALQRGLYNLGFLGVRNTESIQPMLDWWQDRVTRFGFLKPEKGLFVDQKWMDLVPIFFDHVEIFKQPGCDVAYWNLYENDLKFIAESVFSGDQPLMFYHFSAFNLQDPAYIEQLASRFDGEKAQTIRRIYMEYRQALAAHNHDSLRQIPYAYQQKASRISKLKRQLKRTIIRWLDS